MYYTVIQTSGLQGASWKVEKTFTRLVEAQDFADENEQSNPRYDFYNVMIKSHYKPLAKLLRHDSDCVVRFSDGTQALWD
jgi:hypothetical protein